ncbi:MAG: putative 4-cresol dehydrogenase (Hydroxylating) [Bacteroidetes bacterium]|jgi:4-cresol dehydrogenase (hydroxylating)|nr:putative 4-cresol dehydrogenase (Hydroxylating) [Bacteroidota bacterium]
MDLFNISEKDVKRYQSNVTEYSSRTITGIAKPTTFDQVLELIKRANVEKLKLYPFSSGMNWGQGSKLPLVDESLLVDLSHLNRVLEINEKYGYAIIEAGVTQEQLSEALKQTKFKVPVTGSSAQTSVVGNMLERGATGFNIRNSLLLGLEVILGNEKTVRTGMWHFYKAGNAGNQFLGYSKGLGPDLNGLFTQSNMGIVTKMVIKLLPKREGFILCADAKEKDLAIVVDALYNLNQNGVTNGWSMVTNKNDPRTATNGQYEYTGDWLALSAIEGATPEITELLKSEARKSLAPFCENIDFINTATDDEKYNHPYFKILTDVYNGIPSNYSLDAMAQMTGVTLNGDYSIDENKDMIGFSVALPAVPFKGETVLQAVELIKNISVNLGVNPFYNFGSIDNETFEGFYRVYFNRNDKNAINLAHTWNREVHVALEAIGIYPYRANVGLMDHYVNRKDDDFWTTVKNLKSVLDPNNIMAPGRYCAM